MAGAGVASITTLALHDESERCTSCQHFHSVETGGPAAAIDAAIRYLDAYHGRDHLQKVQSPIRGLDGDPVTQTAAFPAKGGGASRSRGVPARKG